MTVDETLVGGGLLARLFLIARRTRLQVWGVTALPTAVDMDRMPASQGDAGPHAVS